MDAWFYHPVDYTTLDVTYTPTEQNLALYSNQVIDLGQGYFVTGLFGVSDWMMCVNVYGRKDTRDLSFWPRVRKTAPILKKKVRPDTLGMHCSDIEISFRWPPPRRWKTVKSP